jgi:hypothetical protein
MRTLAAACLCLSSQFAPALAQQPETERPAPPSAAAATRHAAALTSSTPIHTAPADPAGGAYGIWAAGLAYKASFHDGMTFVPYLGRRYPVTRMVTWRTESAQLGAVDLLGPEPPRHHHTDWRYEYRFAGIVEAYDVLPEGLEQTFVIANKATAGDLRIIGRFGGNLRAQAAPADDGSLVLADGDGVPLVRYGKATAIDRTGRAIEVDAVLDGDRVCLSVSAAALEQAEFPLVVDPLLGTVAGGLHPTADPDSVDVARDDDHDQVAVCYLRHVSAVDQDAWVREFDDGFTNAPGGRLVFTDINTWGVQNIRVCCVGPADDWVAVVNRSLPTVYLRYWVQETTSGVLSTAVTFGANAGGDNQWYADVGGIECFNQSGIGASGSSAMCVYMLDDSAALTHTDATEIWAQRIDVTGAGVVLGTQFQITGAGTDCDFPSITKVSEGRLGALPARWIAVWQRYDSADPLARDWDVIGTQVFDDDTVAGTFLSGGHAANDTHRIGPKVEGQRGRYLVCCGALSRAGVGKPDAVMGRSMIVQRFDWPAGGAITTQSWRTIRGPFPEQRMLIGDVAYDTDTDSHWAILDLDTVDGYMRIHRVGLGGRFLEEQWVSGVPVGLSHNGLGGVCYDDDGNRFCLCWGIPSDVPQNPVSGDYLVFPAEPAPSNMGPTCVPIMPHWEGRDQSGNLIAGNDQQIGNQFCRVTVGGTPAGALHFLVLSTATAFVPLVHPSVAGGCIQLVDMGPAMIGILDVRIGADVYWELALPETLAPFTLYCQDVFLDPAVNRYYTTYRLQVPLVK